ncbi:hypothetical protein BX616_009538 [Lobosporangium transversale]|nr:hypothetical protein BX616_009538 [Lobosporangium transversale]
MLSLQHSLKKLPVPSLEETLAKYLRSIESLTTPEELERSKALAKDFIKPGGLGQVLQQRLLDVDRAAPHNWLDDTWWISKAYHEWRVPLIVNSNWYILVNNETNHPKEFYPTAENPAYTTFQVKRAAHVTQQLLDYIDTLNRQFLNAIKQLKQIKQSAPVGLLTCDDRDAWAVAREHLLVLDPTNRESMQVIEDSLFCIVLDSVAEPTKADPETNFSEWAKFGMHGHGGRNRWCDKSINLLFERDGKMVCYGEHSPCDALIPALIMDTIVRKPTDLNAASSNVDIEAPRHLPFVTDAKTQEHLKAASATIEALSKNSDCGIVHFKDYGVDFIKKYAKVSPDAYIQMALQLAYFKQTGEPCATYETGSTRQFLHGRTETIRTLSPDSLAFCKAMQNPSTTPEERVKLLRVATIAHSQYQKDAGNGKGCDRHLLGLRLCLQPGESHDLFKEPVFAKSTDFLLSTSGLFAGDYFTGTGFGCVSPNGYGINYMPGGKVIKFGIESKFDSKKTDTRAFGELIHQAFREMRAAVEQTLPEDLRKTSAKL